MDRATEDGIKLKIARIQAGLRQFELAARLGISPPRLCEIEAGRRAVTPEMAELIRKAISEMALTVRGPIPAIYGRVSTAGAEDQINRAPDLG